MHKNKSVYRINGCKAINCGIRSIQLHAIGLLLFFLLPVSNSAFSQSSAAIHPFYISDSQFKILYRVLKECVNQNGNVVIPSSYMDPKFPINIYIDTCTNKIISLLFDTFNFEMMVSEVVGCAKINRNDLILREMYQNGIFCDCNFDVITNIPRGFHYDQVGKRRISK